MKRLVHTMITLIVVLVLLFVIFRLMPGDPSRFFIRPGQTQADTDALKVSFGFAKEVPAPGNGYTTTFATEAEGTYEALLTASDSQGRTQEFYFTHSRQSLPFPPSGPALAVTVSAENGDAPWDVNPGETVDVHATIFRGNPAETFAINATVSRAGNFVDSLSFDSFGNSPWTAGVEGPYSLRVQAAGDLGTVLLGYGGVASNDPTPAPFALVEEHILTKPVTVTLTRAFLNISVVSGGATITTVVAEVRAPTGVLESTSLVRPTVVVDNNVLEEFWAYLTSMIQGNFGKSLYTRNDVWKEISIRVGPSLLLFGSATIIAYLIGILVGAVLAWRRGSKTELSSIVVSLFFHSMPVFWFGLILLWAFAFSVDWFPLGGFGGVDDEGRRLEGFAYVGSVLHHMALPLLNLVILSLAGTILLMRNAMLEVMGEDYIVTARAKGITERKVMYRHAARNAMLPVVTAFALSISGVISGGVLTETIFSWPGMGAFLVDSTLRQDFPSVQGAFFLLALLAPFMGLRDPIRWTAPDDDTITDVTIWGKNSLFQTSDLYGAPPVNQPIAFRVLPDDSDARSDRVYLAATNRLYALRTQPGAAGVNAWGFTRYFNISAFDGQPRAISAPPLVMNYGDYVGIGGAPPDYEIYLGSDDGNLFILRDVGTGFVPSGVNAVRLPLSNSGITGLAAFSGDETAPVAVEGWAYYAQANGSSWLIDRVPGSADAGEYTSLGFNATGPHLAYYDVQEGRPRFAAPSAGTWRPALTEIEPPLPVNVGLYTSLAFDASGFPRLAYYDETAGDLKYAAWNGTGWTVIAVDYVGDTGRYASLALDSAGNPFIAHQGVTDGSLRLTYSDGLAWFNETVDVSSTTGFYASLALDALDNPHIAYYDATNGDLEYAAKVGLSWTYETVDAAGDVGQYASLRLDASGAPRIAYYDAGAGDLRYAEKSGVTWNRVVVDGGPSDTGRYASLALDPSGNPAIAYHDATDLDLKFARYDPIGGTWSNSTVDSAGNAGLYTSLQFNGSAPSIGYYTFAAGRTTRDVAVVGTSAGTVYAIEAGIPRSLVRIDREKRVFEWDYRVRWTVELGSPVHIADGPKRSVSLVPLYSPAFDRNGATVFVGTEAGSLWALRVSDGGSVWTESDGVTPRSARIGAPWRTAPVVEEATEGPLKGREIVYATSGYNDYDGDGEAESLLFALLPESGEAIPEWRTFPYFAAYGGAAPVSPTPTRITPDGGDLTQPTVKGDSIYFGSTSGTMYGYRRDGLLGVGAAGLEPAALRWRFSDPTLQGLFPTFASAPIVLPERDLLLTAGNHRGTDPGPSDDRGILYSLKLEGNLSWKKAMPAPIRGSPSSWTEPSPSLQQAVWVSYGEGPVLGVASLRVAGEFLPPSPPSWVTPYKSGNTYWLGLDSQGRDIFSQVIWGSRIALLVGFLAAFFTVFIGIVVGLIAGFMGGKIEAVLMRFTDVILVLPGLPLIITLAAVLGPSIWNIILVISLLGWPGIARIIRAEVLSLKERPFIDSARVTGASSLRIVFRHIAPNVMPLAFLYMTFAVSGAILAEAALSFIGLGDATVMSWGIMLQLVFQSQALTAWYWVLPPGLAITLVSLAFFLVGRAFDEIVNPRLRKR